MVEAELDTAKVGTKVGVACACAAAVDAAAGVAAGAAEIDRVATGAAGAAGANVISAALVVAVTRGCVSVAAESTAMSRPMLNKTSPSASRASGDACAEPLSANLPSSPTAMVSSCH